MSESGPAARQGTNARSWSRVLEHVRFPLHRDGYALALNTAITSVVGLLYWVIAARVYSRHEVGLNSALIAAMQFVAGVATLNLENILVRFLPEAGTRARRLLLWVYAATGVLAVAGVVVFVLTAGWLSDELSFVGKSPELVITFGCATVAWCVFVLQDGALTGLGQAIWVPVENAVFAVVKVLLLVAFAGLMPTYGIFGSWTLAMVLAVTAVNVLLFGRFARRPAPAEAGADAQAAQHRVAPGASDAATSPRRQGARAAASAGRMRMSAPARAFAPYLAADLTCALAWIASTALLPVIVTAVSGAAANAAFALAWAVAFPLYAVTASLGSALVVHASGDPGALPELRSRALRQGLGIVGGAATAMVALAPWILRMFGESYAEDGATILRLVALGAVPNLLVTLWVSEARVRRRMRGPVIVLVTQAVVTLGLVAPLLNELGVVGGGVAWLTGQAVAMPVAVWRSGRARSEPPPRPLGLPSDLLPGRDRPSAPAVPASTSAATRSNLQ